MADTTTPLEQLRLFAEAKRFDRQVFDDDTALADWVQSRARHLVALGGQQPEEAADRRVGDIFSTLRYVLGVPPAKEEATPSEHYQAILDRIASWPLVGADAHKSAASLKARELLGKQGASHG